jgi:hypothetical protein
MISRAGFVVVMFTAVLCCSPTAAAQPTPSVRLNPDFANAKAVVDLYRKGSVDEADIDRLMSLEGTRGIIAQAQRFQSDATEERFVQDLRVSVAGGDVPEPDYFQFNRIRKNLQGIERSISWIEENPDALSRTVLDLLSPYSPLSEPLEIKYFVTIGGSSDGWTRDGVFHIALQYFGDDVEGLLTLLSHEVYHIVQWHFMAPAVHEDRTREQRVEQLLLSAIGEGMASYVANPLKTEGGGSYTQWYSRKYQRNLNHLKLNFDLLETLIYRAYHDASVPLGDLYSIGFSGALESPAYFVGFEMARVIEEASGRAKLLELLQQPAAEFFAHYASIADGSAGEVIPLGESIREILGELRVSSGE